jgi:LysM repeat protein
MDGRRRSPARLLAPISLIAFVLVLFIVIATSGTDEDSGDGGSSISQQQTDQVSTTGDTTTTTPTVSGNFYTVKTGDTLAGIAEEVGVPVARLQELNPALDPQALVSGQKIRIRE